MRIVILLALLASACGVPTAPSDIDGRNPDGTIHRKGEPLQPWIRTINAPIERTEK